MEFIKELIKKNDHDGLLVKLKDHPNVVQDQSLFYLDTWINYMEDYQLETIAFYGLIGWALYVRADLQTFQILVSCGAPTSKVREYGTFYNAYQTAHDMALPTEICQFLKNS